MIYGFFNFIVRTIYCRFYIGFNKTSWKNAEINFPQECPESTVHRSSSLQPSAAHNKCLQLFFIPDNNNGGSVNKFTPPDSTINQQLRRRVIAPGHTTALSGRRGNALSHTCTLLSWDKTLGVWGTAARIPVSRLRAALTHWSQAWLVLTISQYHCNADGWQEGAGAWEPPWWGYCMHEIFRGRETEAWAMWRLGGGRHRLLWILDCGYMSSLVDAAWMKGTSSDGESYKPFLIVAFHLVSVVLLSGES